MAPPSLRRKTEVHVEFNIELSDDPRIQKKVITPTPEVQTIYNTIRRSVEHEMKQKQQQQLLHPPATPHSLLSPTDESYTNGSPAYSPANSLDNSHHDLASQGAAESKRPRGKRSGPLPPETRIKTAFKRKTGLICDQHRAKRTTCNCIDLTKLEAAYEPAERSPARSRPESRVSGPAPVSIPDGTSSFGDLGTFGTGGAALMPSPRFHEMSELEAPAGIPTVVRPSIQSTINFDLNSSASITAMTQAPLEQPFYPGASTNPDQGGLLLIGSEMPGFSVRWQCEFKPSTDTESEASTESCGWTGPFKDLCSHFQASHREFENAELPYWSKCTRCATEKSNWNTNTRCTEENCSNALWQKLFYGSTVKESSMESFPTFTQSGASEGGFSWTLNPGWNYPNWGGTEPSSWFGSYTCGSSYYEHSNNGESTSDVHDNSLGWVYSKSPNALRSLFRIHTARCDPKQRAGHLDTRLICGRVSPSTPPGCRVLAGLSRSVKSPWQQFIPIVAPLMATIIRGPCSLLVRKLTASYLNGGPCVIKWWSLVMVVLGFLATWIFKNGTSCQRNSNEESDTRSRECSGRQVFEDVGTPLCII